MCWESQCWSGKFRRSTYHAGRGYCRLEIVVNTRVMYGKFEDQSSIDEGGGPRQKILELHPARFDGRYDVPCANVLLDLG